MSFLIYISVFYGSRRIYPGGTGNVGLVMVGGVFWSHGGLRLTCLEVDLS